MLANPTSKAGSSVTAKLVQGQGLRLTCDRRTGKLWLFIDLITGRFDVLLSGSLTAI